MAEKHARWGAADSPRTIDERIIRRVGRGEIAMHHRWEKNTTVGRGEIAMHHRRENNTTGGAGGAHHRKITAKSQRLLRATHPPREDNGKDTTTSSCNN